MLKSAIKPILVPPLDVIDRLVRRVVGPRDVPSFRLRMQQGRLAYFDTRRWIGVGEQMVGELRTFCGLTPTHDVLEIGCDHGIAARALRSYFTSGSYTGLDIDAPSIEWCRRNYGGDRMHFVHQDIAQAYYNPTGSQESLETPLPFDAESFDRVFLISVMTHMYPDEVEHYLLEISRVLRPGGRCLASLLTKDRYDPDSSPVPLRHRINEDLLAWNATEPTKAFAHSESLLTTLVARSGMRVASMAPGSWDGRTQAPHFHDMYVFEPL